MDQKNFSKPLSLAKVQVTDAFWKKKWSSSAPKLSRISGMP